MTSYPTEDEAQLALHKQRGVKKERIWSIKLLVQKHWIVCCHTGSRRTVKAASLTARCFTSSPDIQWERYSSVVQRPTNLMLSGISVNPHLDLLRIVFAFTKEAISVFIDPLSDGFPLSVVYGLYLTREAGIYLRRPQSFLRYSRANPGCFRQYPASKPSVFL